MEERKRAQRASRSINYVCVEGKKESRKSVCVCVKWLFFCISGGERDARRKKDVHTYRREKRKQRQSFVLYMHRGVSMKSPAVTFVFENHFL